MPSSSGTTKSDDWLLLECLSSRDASDLTEAADYKDLLSCFGSFWWLWRFAVILE